MNKILNIMLSMTIGIVCLTGCMPAGTQPPGEVNLVQLQPPKEGQEMAIMTTNMGVIKFVLYEDYAPNTVAHFKKLVQEGFYNNNPIFSVQKEVSSMLAGATDDVGNEGKVVTEDGEKIKPETSKDVWHFSGAVSAIGDEEGIFAKTIMSDSRFFIVGNREADTEILEQLEENNYPEKVISAYKELGGMPVYTGRFTVFGQVVEGLDIVDDIINQETKKTDEGQDTGIPAEELIIESIELSAYSFDDSTDGAE